MRSRCPIPIKKLYVEGIGEYSEKFGVGLLRLIPSKDFVIQEIGYLLCCGRSYILTDAIYEEFDIQRQMKKEYWRFLYK